MITITNTKTVADNTIVINGSQFFVTDEVAKQILALCQGSTPVATTANTATKPVAKKPVNKYLVKSDKPVAWSLDPDGSIHFKFEAYVGKKVYKVASNKAIAFAEEAKKRSLKKVADRKAFVKWMNEKCPVIKAEEANKVQFVWERG